MLHAKFQGNRTSGSGEEDFKGYYHIWVWPSSWSCDLYHLYKLSFPLPKEDSRDLALIGQLVSEKMFENHGYIHIYSPGTEADNLLRSTFFINSIIQSK